MGDAFQRWVDEVCGQVRFWPDRRDIERELRTHYEDHRRALEALHYEPELAAERSLRAMGDAGEVGRGLDRVHRPWLGWLWEVSRVLLLAMAVSVLAATLSRTSGWSRLMDRTRDQLDWEAPPALAASVELEHGTLWAAPVELAEEDGHVLARVGLWVETRRPLTAERGVLTGDLIYRDDCGQLESYSSDPYTRRWTESRYWHYGDPAGEGWTRFRQTVELVLDRPPEWVEIAYPASGDWTLRLEWGELS